MEKNSSWERELWSVIWKFKPGEYEPDPKIRFLADDLETREEAEKMMNACLRNPRCAYAAVVRKKVRYIVEEMFPGGGNADG